MMRVYIIQRRFSNLVFWSSGLTKNKYAVTILRRIKTMSPSHPLLCASSGVDLVSSVFCGVFPLQTFICVAASFFKTFRKEFSDADIFGSLNLYDST